MVSAVMVLLHFIR